MCDVLDSGLDKFIAIAKPSSRQVPYGLSIAPPHPLQNTDELLKDAAAHRVGETPSTPFGRDASSCLRRDAWLLVGGDDRVAERAQLLAVELLLEGREHLVLFLLHVVLDAGGEHGHRRAEARFIDELLHL